MNQNEAQVQAWEVQKARYIKVLEVKRREEDLLNRELAYFAKLTPGIGQRSFEYERTQLKLAYLLIDIEELEGNVAALNGLIEQLSGKVIVPGLHPKAKGMVRQ